jgi:hypothetical protein
MTRALALPLACVLCPRGFAAAAGALPSCFAAAANGSRLRFAFSLHSLPLQLPPRGFATAACALLSRPMALARALP